MASPAHLYAWFACVFCVAFTLRCAFAFAQKQPDIFLGLCVYAGQFAVLIVFYSDPKNPSDLLPALSGYFAALAGFLIIRRHFSRGSSEGHHLRPSEQAVAWLLLLIALPRFVTTPFGRSVLPTVDEGAVEVFVTMVLDTIGYYALYKAVMISQPKKWTSAALASPLVVYWALNVTFSSIQLYRRVYLEAGPLPMPDTFRYGFAIIKVITVLTFVPAVLAPYEPFAKSTWDKRALVFLHLAAGE